MGTFLTRIELHDTSRSGEEYELLHEEMRKLGFKRSIPRDDGKRYQLPTAEYHSIHDDTSDGVMEIAKIAANKTGLKYSVVVANCFSISFDYLDVVKS